MRAKRNYSKCLLLLTIILILALTMIIRNVEIKRRAITHNENIIKEGVKDDKISDDSKSDLLCEILIQQLGKPYVYGKDGPDSFDCSGLVEYSYSRIGIKLPRVASEQTKEGYFIDKDDLRFGDIVFFSNDGTNLTHTGIYVGKGYMIHAPKTGEVVKISTINSGYYSKTYKQAIRVLDENTSNLF